MKCYNVGCTKEYLSDKNTDKNCMHHPGRFDFGSELGMWPEGWTCCRKEWDAPPCTLGYHRGHPKAAFIKYCINHGEQNPDSHYPDGFCGRPFIYKEPTKKGEEGNDEACLIHPGYFKVRNRKTGDGVWTCCQGETRETAPCAEDRHKFAEWPDEEAKKYFFDRPLKYPGESKVQPSRGDFELYGRYSGFYRRAIIVPYEPKNPGRPPTLSADEEKKMNIKDRYCLNWSCRKVYKQINNHKKACKCHPGRWDFGYSG